MTMGTAGCFSDASPSMMTNHRASVRVHETAIGHVVAPKLLCAEEFLHQLDKALRFRDDEIGE